MSLDGTIFCTRCNFPAKKCRCDDRSLAPSPGSPDNVVAFPSERMQLSQIRQRAQNLVREAQQIISDTAHWNECVRSESEEKIEADPDGSVARTICYASDVVRQCDKKLAALSPVNAEVKQ